MELINEKHAKEYLDGCFPERAPFEPVPGNPNITGNWVFRDKHGFEVWVDPEKNILWPHTK